MSPVPRAPLVALYTLSGGGGLVLEAAFVRQLGWTLGAGPVTWAITLAGFLGGLALGAALLAGLAVGVWPDLETIRAAWRADRVFEPRMDQQQVKTLLGNWAAAVKKSY